MKLVFVLLVTVFGLAAGRIIPLPKGRCNCASLIGNGFKYSSDKCNVVLNCKDGMAEYISRNTTTTTVDGKTSAFSFETKSVVIVAPGDTLPTLTCVNSKWDSLDKHFIKAVTHLKCLNFKADQAPKLIIEDDYDMIITKSLML